LAPLRNHEWVVYSKRPFGGPAEVLRYLARYTHRVAISNRRLVALNDKGVTFKWKDYRREGRERYAVMTLDSHEFIRRFRMHVLPQGFHRVRYYGLRTRPTRAKNIARIRKLFAVPLIAIDAITAAHTKASTSAQPEKPKAPQASLPLLRRPHANHLTAKRRRRVVCPLGIQKCTPTPSTDRTDRRPQRRALLLISSSRSAADPITAKSHAKSMPRPKMTTLSGHCKNAAIIF